MSAKALSLSFAIVLISSAGAADKDVESFLSHMRDAYRAIKVVAFTTESHFGATVYVNSFSYVSPSKIRLDITSPGGSDFKDSLVKISDGKSIAMKLPGSTDFSHQDFTADSYNANLPVNLESMSFWDAGRQLSTSPGNNMEHSALKLFSNQDWNGKKWTVLEETAAEQKVVCRYFVDPKTYLIWRTVVRPIGAEQDYEDSWITKMDTSARIPTSKFTLPG